MKKILLLSGLAFSSMCHGVYYDSQTLITFNEPITVRVMDVYCFGFNTELGDGLLNYNYSQDWVITNIANGKVYYNYTTISSDYQVELTPNEYNGSSVFTTFELNEIPESIRPTRQKYIGNTEWVRIDCTRLIGYLVNDRWLDKNGNDITDKFNLMADLNELRNRQRASRIHPDMQLNSIISMTENTPKISFDIVYSGEKVVWGKKELTDSEWVDVTDLDKSEYRFFKVSLKSN